MTTPRSKREPSAPPARRLGGSARTPSSDQIFAALGDPTRLALVRSLSDGVPLSIARLTEGRAVTRQAITRHLGVLRRARLVRSVRRGRENCFELERESLDAAKSALDSISRQWDLALNRLKSMLESESAQRGQPSRTRQHATRSRTEPAP